MKSSESEITRDLEKIIKFLAIKAAHVIIKARMGERISTPCNPSYHKVDTFNLSVPEIPDVIGEVKKLLMYEKITQSNPFYVEISLETPEGDSMVLEYWSIGIHPEKCDVNDRILCTTYSRLGILLKSLVSITCVTPAYKLSKRQGYEAYVMCYKIHFGEPPVKNLGEGARTKTLAQVCTPIGTIHLTVSYRTQMTISPSHTKENSSIMVKSDHFDSKNNIRNSYNENEDGRRPIIGAFVDSSYKVFVPPTDEEPLLSTKIMERNRARLKELKERREKQEKEEQEKQKLKEQEEKDKENQSENKQVKSSLDTLSSTLQTVSVHDDFLLVNNVKPAFAFNSKCSDIQEFYKMLKTPPEHLLSNVSSSTSSSESSMQWLQEYEQDVNKFDEFERSLHQLSPENA